VPAILEARGLKEAKVRRLALVGWSAGYGAVMRALAHGPHADRVDAVILLDGLHTSYREGTNIVEPASLVSIEAFARRAMKGEKLFVLTHSNIQPMGYLGVRETTDYLLGKLELTRTEVDMKTEIPDLEAAKGVLPKADLRPLELRTEVRSGGFIVRGFGGDQAAHHISHLMQMSQIALPELAKRWTPIEPGQGGQGN
jgi:pimeloyl-ACP methyl ester carboxylesterase